MILEKYRFPTIARKYFSKFNFTGYGGKAQVTSGYINYWRAPQECTLVLIKIMISLALMLACLVKELILNM